MKRVFVSLFSIFTCLLFSCSGLEKPFFLPCSDGKIKYEGRFLFEEGDVRYDYPGSRISVNFYGSSVKAKVKPNAGFYTYSIDGGDEVKISSSLCSLDSFISLAEGLPLDSHTVRLTLVSEGLFVKPAFYGFEFENGAKVLAKSEAPHRVEFIGNSITCAYGVEANNENEHFDDSTSNFTKSYASIVCEKFGVDRMIVARSGIGVYRNYDGDKAGSKDAMPKIYRQMLISEENSVWEPSLYSPEVIFINLGTNDFSTTGADTVLFEQAYNNFLDGLRMDNPKARIVVLCGCMLNSSTGLDAILPILDRIVRKRNEGGDSLICRFNFTPQNGSLGYGADWHPSEKQQQLMASELVPFLSKLTGWNEK